MVNKSHQDLINTLNNPSKILSTVISMNMFLIISTVTIIKIIKYHHQVQKNFKQPMISKILSHALWQICLLDVGNN